MLYTLLVCMLLLAAYVYLKKSPEQGVVGRIIAPHAPVTPDAPSSEPSGSTPQMFENPSESTPQAVQAPALQLPPPAQNRTKTSEAHADIAYRAMEKFREGKYEEAIRLFKEIAHNDMNARAGIGMSYYMLGDYDRAIENIEKSFEDHSDDFLRRKALAFSYFKKDNFEKSLTHAEAGLAMKKDPELQALYSRLPKEKAVSQRYVGESNFHFKVMFDGHEHGGVSRLVLGILEDAYRAVGRELDYYPSEPVQVILYTGKDFTDITQAPEWAGGLYDGKIRLPVRGAERNEALLKQVLFHEYTHAVVHLIARRIPLWINEGLAEYFSRSYPRKSGQLIPLNYLENSFSWLGGERVGIAYWESYSAVSALIERYGMYRVKQMLLAFSKGNDPNQAFSEAFSNSYNEFIAAWGKP